VKKVNVSGILGKNNYRMYLTQTQQVMSN